MRKRVYKVIMEDAITHTVNFPVCNVEGCICVDLEYELLLQSLNTPVQPRKQKRTLVNWTSDSDKAQLNNRQQGFRLLK
jgi:hypothetical protein